MEQEHPRNGEDRQNRRNATAAGKSWHPRLRFGNAGRIREALRRQACRRWLPLLLAAILTHSVPAQSNAPPDADLAPDHMQTGSLLPYGQNTHVISGFPATANNAGWYRTNGLVLIATALLLLLVLMAGRHGHASPARN